MNRPIVLPSLAGPLPQYIVVHHKGDDQEWRITNIEIYGDAELTLLWADDIQFASLPKAAQLQLVASLNDWLDQERALRQLLARDIQQLGLEGAFV
jgi:predicted ribonuclease YlaK